jgi:aminoglycoside phosphotransferase (APT) family kinase protein
MTSMAPIREELTSYLRERLGSSVSVTDLEHHTTGWSRTTYSFDATWVEEGTDCHERFVLRQYSEEGLLETSLEKEYAVMDAMGDTPVPVPDTFWYCEDPTILGDPFFYHILY